MTERNILRGFQVEWSPSPSKCCKVQNRYTEYSLNVSCQRLNIFWGLRRQAYSVNAMYCDSASKSYRKSPSNGQKSRAYHQDTGKRPDIKQKVKPLKTTKWQWLTEL